MKTLKLAKLGSSFEFLPVLEDISWPTSIHEIALKSACATLPTNLLQLAFSTYSDLDKDSRNDQEPLEFLDIPDQLQVPPFLFRKPSKRSNKWSSKFQPSGDLVGPILPPHFLTTLHALWEDELKEEKELYLEDTEAFSAHSQFKLRCDNVLEVIREHISGSDFKTQDDIVSLADDTEDMSYGTQKLNFSCHKPSATFNNSSTMDHGEPGCENYVFSTHVFRRSQELASDISAVMVGKELFDVGCPIELNFDDCTIDFGSKELEIFRNLKKQDLEFQRCFKPYQDYLSRGDELK